MNQDPTTPSEATQAFEQRDATTTAHADISKVRDNTDIDELEDDQRAADPEVAAHYKAMMERGAHQVGEGRIE